MRTTIPRLTLATAGILSALALSAGAAHASIGLIGSITTSTPGVPLGHVEKLAVNQDSGEVYITDAEHQRVVKYDPSGSFILTFGREVNATKVKEREAGNTVSEAEENVCTAASGDECQAGTAGSGPGQFNGPNLVVVDPSTGDVYVTDALGSTQEFNANGGYIAQLPIVVSAVVSAVDLEGNLFYESREGLQKFSSAGVYTGIEFKNPTNIAVTSVGVDAEGNVYMIAEGGDAQETSTGIFKFEPSGKLLGLLGNGDPTEGSLAVDLLTDDIFTFGEPHKAGEEYPLLEYESTGGLVASYPSGISFGSTPPFGETPPRAMAFAAATGKLYVIKGGGGEHEVLIYGTFSVPAAQAPAISGVSASAGGSMTSGRVAAQVNPNLAETTYSFQYAASPSFAGATSIPAAPVSIGAGFLPVKVSAEISGLQPSTTYYTRVLAHSSFGGGAGTTVTGPTEAFTTTAPPPSASTEAASEVAYDAARVSGMVLPGSVGAASDTRWCFEYGTGGGGAYNLGSLPLLAGDAGQGSTGVPVSLRLTGLAPGSTYHYRLVAVNSLGLGLESIACGTEGGREADGAQGTFTTPITFPAPLAVSGAASEVSQSAAVISGSVDPEGVSTSYEFQLGLDTSYGAEVFGEAGAGIEPEVFTLALGYLQPDTTYHYRLVAISDGGTSYGADETFTTSGFLSAALSAPPTTPLLATPVFAFPVLTTVEAKHTTVKTKPKPKKKRKGKGKRGVGRQGRKAGKAGRRGRRGAGNGRSGR